LRYDYLKIIAMPTYIAILRGINVSGQKKILMADLRVLFEDLNFQNVRTYIQSGNVVFASDGQVSTHTLAHRIEKAILKIYQFDVPVLVYSAREIRQILHNNPFLKEKDIDITKLHVTFLASTPSSENLSKLTALNYAPDRFIPNGFIIYVYCPNGYGRSKLTNNNIENKLKVQATTRNWKTVNMLVEMANRFYNQG
jgi:uncharacterized protein (DUF1697 family)